MIVDASAIVAIVARETDADRLSRQLLTTSERWTHAISIYEAALALVRLKRIALHIAEDDLNAYFEITRIGVLPLTAATAEAALAAFARYGKGRHPAALNMGDCFSYACAKLRGMPLLYKGEDFALTDLA